MPIYGPDGRTVTSISTEEIVQALSVLNDRTKQFQLQNFQLGLMVEWMFEKLAASSLDISFDRDEFDVWARKRVEEVRVEAAAFEANLKDMSTREQVNLDE
jgi:hypothetical protein